MDIEAIREEFPVLEEWVFFNHAAVAPLSRPARNKIADWADDIMRRGDIHEGLWIREIEHRRLAAARLMNARVEEIALLKNTSEGLGLIAEGFPWKEGDNVIICEGEYPSNVYPWMHLADRGVEVRTVPLDGVRIRPEDIESRMDRRTRLLSVSFVQFASGFRSDLVRLGELCRKRDVDFCVDAIQGLGVFPIDVDAMNIDYLSADGHKWLVSPEGAAIVFIRAEKIEKIRAVGIGWKSVVGDIDFSKIDFRLKPSAARYESGSLNMPGFLALGANIELFERVGVTAIEARLHSITNELVERLGEVRAEVHSVRGDGEWSGIVSFSLADVEAGDVVKHCRNQGVVVTARGGRLRASPHFYNNSADIDRAIRAMSNLPR